MSKLAALRDRFNLSRLAIQFGWVTILFWLLVSLAGFYAFTTLKYALFPDITFPVVVINATTSTNTILDTESQLVVPLESELRELPGLRDMRSTVYPGRALVTLSFKVGTNLEASTTTVESRLNQVNLPPDTYYEILPLNLNEVTVVSYALESQELSLTELGEIATDQILPALGDLPGILRVDLLGTGATATPDDPQEGERSSATLMRFNGKDVLAVQVIKEEAANSLEVVKAVSTTLANLQSSLPQVQITEAFTQAEYVREATQATIDALVQAVFLAVLVIFIFLRNWQATLITALAIPLSLLGTCLVMAYFGFNLETITLLALALVVGIVVDDAIVEVENIARHLDEGEPPLQAALTATTEIGLTVIASTLTIVAVFLPIALMEGTIGQFFKPFGITVSAAVLISLLVARTLSPVLAVKWLKPSLKPAVQRQEVQAITGLEQAYFNLLAWSLQHRGIVVSLAVLSFAGGVALIPSLPKGFIPKLNRGEFNVTYTAPLPQRPLAASTPDLSNLTPEQLALAAQARVQQVNPPTASPAESSPLNPLQLLLKNSRETAVPIEETILQMPDTASVLTTIGIRGEPNRGRLYVRLKQDRLWSTAEIQDQLRTLLPQQEGVTVSIEDIQFVELGGSKPLQLVVVGEDLDQLKIAAEAARAQVEILDGVEDVTLTGFPDPEGGQYSLTRLNGRRVVTLSANLSQGAAVGDATDQAVAAVKTVLPPQVSLELEGDSKLSNTVFSSFAGTLLLSVLCMMILLIIPFGGLLEPLVVALSLPLSIIGAVLALLLTQSDFGMISFIGIIFLLGLLDKNALLIMDCANQLRRAGLNRTQALLKTGLLRMRPILMTSASTILGMIPLALGLGAGAELRQPMAVAIIGGLTTSTLLSLIVVPVLYTLLEDWWQGIRRLGSPPNRTQS